jgi:hypothetical protein
MTNYCASKRSLLRAATAMDVLLSAVRTGRRNSARLPRQLARLCYGMPPGEPRACRGPVVKAVKGACPRSSAVRREPPATRFGTRSRSADRIRPSRVTGNPPLVARASASISG